MDGHLTPIQLGHLGESGARVGVGMLRGAGGSWFQSFEDSQISIACFQDDLNPVL